MNDLYLDWRGDLALGASGDITLAKGPDAISQRLIRRLLTNPGDYIWNVGYGGGLAQFVGMPAKPADIEAVIRTQLSLESSVPSDPAPTVNAAVIDAANGYFSARISYADPKSNLPVQLTVVPG